MEVWIWYGFLLILSDFDPVGKGRQSVISDHGK